MRISPKSHIYILHNTFSYYDRICIGFIYWIISNFVALWLTIFVLIKFFEFSKLWFVKHNNGNSFGCSPYYFSELLWLCCQEIKAFFRKYVCNRICMKLYNLVNVRSTIAQKMRIKILITISLNFNTHSTGCYYTKDQTTA